MTTLSILGIIFSILFVLLSFVAFYLHHKNKLNKFISSIFGITLGLFLITILILIVLAN